jgi:hypothetical protein
MIGFLLKKEKKESQKIHVYSMGLERPFFWTQKKVKKNLNNSTKNKATAISK